MCLSIGGYQHQIDISFYVHCYKLLGIWFLVRSLRVYVNKILIKALNILLQTRNNTQQSHYILNIDLSKPHLPGYSKYLISSLLYLHKICIQPIICLLSFHTKVDCYIITTGTSDWQRSSWTNFTKSMASTWTIIKIFWESLIVLFTI